MEAFVAAREISMPVFFSDGVEETSLGTVSVSSRFNFKQFQSSVGEKLGLSAHQFSIYLTESKNRGSRVPVTGKMDFAAVSRDKDCVFLVVLKQPRRRERRRKARGMAGMGRHESDPPANVMLLRRDGNSVAINDGGFSRRDTDRSGFERRIKDLQMEKERYLMSWSLAFEGISLEPEPERTKTAIVCHECLRDKEIGRDSGFHWCIYDAVISGFRSPAGPISRPVKVSG